MKDKIKNEARIKTKIKKTKTNIEVILP